MPLIFRDVEALADELRDRLAARAIIGIDGWTGVGKTTLGRKLAADLGASLYDLDEALIKDQQHYFSALRLADVREAFERPRRLLFVSGICVRRVLAELGTTASAHIYMKRMASWGWADEDELSGRVPEFSGASGEQVRKELQLYHESWQPHATADYEFHRLS